MSAQAVPGPQLAKASTQSGPDLPPEILGRCFHFLPLLTERFRAAHVSRYWRECALSFPSLWADIDLASVVRAGSQVEFLDLALSRSALYPVDLECSVRFDSRQFIVQLVKKHMHHIRSIVWHGSVHSRSADFTWPAPILESFVCIYLMNIPSNFLGGRAGVLRRVELAELVLPETCPALAGVTHLIASAPGRKAASSISRIFSIFLSLVFLSLKGLPRDDDRLPEMGRAPRTLAHLSLQTKHTKCNLGQYTAALVPEECKDIRLALPMAGSSGLAVLLRDALELVLLPRNEEGRSSALAPMVVSLPESRMLTVEFKSYASIDPGSESLVSSLLVVARFVQLRALTMPLYTVQNYFRTCPLLSSLSELCIILPPATSSLSHQVGVLDLTKLHSLALLRPYALARCTLDAGTHWRPSKEDAVAVLEHIAQYGLAGVEYVLRGFPSDVVDAVPIPAELGGFYIHFEVSCIQYWRGIPFESVEGALLERRLGFQRPRLRSFQNDDDA